MIQYRGETNLCQTDWWSQIEGPAARDSLKVFICWFVRYLKWFIPGVECFVCFIHCCIPAPIPIQSPTSGSVYGRSCWLLILGNTSQCLQHKMTNFRAGLEPFFKILMEPLLLHWGKFPGLQLGQFMLPLCLWCSWWGIPACSSQPVGRPCRSFLATLKWCAPKSNPSSALFRFISILLRNPLQLWAESTGVGVEIRCFCSPENGAVKYQMFQGYIYLDL